MYWSIFKVNIFLALVGVVFAQDFPDLSNLGSEITAEVNARVAPLHNLGQSITSKIQERMRPLDNLGQSIAAKVQEKTKPLENLGQKIKDSVDKGLEPVRAMEMTFKMKGGVGGYTVATHLPQGRKFIMLNNQPYTCTGPISPRSGRCKGQMLPFEITSEKDHCYLMTSYSIINNHICIGANSMTIINNDINCVSRMGTQGLLLTLPEFRKLCGGISETVEYKYTANPKDSSHVNLPTDNQFVKCATQKKGVCVFTENQPGADLTGFDGILVSRNGNFVSNVVHYN